MRKHELETQKPESKTPEEKAWDSREMAECIKKIIVLTENWTYGNELDHLKSIKTLVEPFKESLLV
jgi:hypothetical protein